MFIMMKQTTTKTGNEDLLVVSLFLLTVARDSGVKGVSPAPKCFRSRISTSPSKSLPPDSASPASLIDKI